MDNEPRFPWQKVYLEAVTEFDPAKLAIKIGEAQRAISSRLREAPNDPDELQALQDALHGLHSLTAQNKNAKSGAA